MSNPSNRAKSLTLRVTSVIPCTSAIAPMSASRRCRLENVHRRRTSRDRRVDGKGMLIEARVDAETLAVAHLAEGDISGCREWTHLGWQDQGADSRVMSPVLVVGPHPTSTENGRWPAETRDPSSDLIGRQSACCGDVCEHCVSIGGGIMEPTTADSTGLTTDSENLATHVAASERHATVVV